MACSLNEDQIGDVYKLIYKKLSGANPSESFDLKGLIKKIYNGVLEATEDTGKALQYAQAVPDIFNIVSNNSKINDLLDEMDFDTNIIRSLRRQFQDLEKVSEYVVEEQETFDDVENKLKEINKTKEDVVISDDSELSQSDLESRNSAKIEFPNVTSLQTSASKNPAGFKKGDDRNPDDPKKTVFNIVQKNIIAAINFSSINETEVLYGDTPIILSATKSSAFPNEYKLAEHLSSEDSESVGIYAVITDTDGNYLFFDKEGNITDAENGTVVYTFLRKVEKIDGVLTLLYSRTLGKGENRKLYRYKNTLVDALKIANREADILAAQGGEIDNDWVDIRAQEIFEEQTALMNGLYKLRKEVESSENPVKLNITGGSLGIAPEVYAKPISQLGITEEDLATYDIIKDENNTKKGRPVITVHVDTPVGKIPQIIDMQRGDFDENLAEKVATVLTTKAKLPTGKELDNEQRQAYFEIFIDNSLEKSGNGFYGKYNRENITVKIKDGALVVSIKDFEGKETVIKGDELYTDKAKAIIKGHLKVNKTSKKGNSYPASVQFNEKVKALGYFPDYEVNGDKITVNTVMYIPFIKNYAKANFSVEYAKFAYGNNPYLTYEIPAEYMGDSEYAIEAENVKVNSAPPKTNEEKYKESRIATEAVSEEIPFEEEVNFITDDTIDKVDLSDMPEDLDDDFDADMFERNKRLETFLDKLFTTEADKAAAEDWWKNSPLNKDSQHAKNKKYKHLGLIGLERISKVVNSDAFATFMGTGITLYEGDGGTPIDIYHEAWHGFSQLFLTKAEKIKLYSELKGQPKWANNSFFEIEEDIAEDFRDYAKSKGKKEEPKGFLGEIFRRIYQFLNNIFGKVSRTQAVLRPRDIPAVKELFDKLYEASNRPELLQHMQPSTENLMFTKLNRAKVIRPLKEFKSQYTEFTESESLKAASLIDSILPKIFMAYNKAKDNSGGAIKILYNNSNRVAMYETVQKRLKTMFENLKRQTAELAINGEDVPDNLLSNLVFIEKMITNFGDVRESVEGSQKSGVVTYHLENSRFKILANTYVEVDNDPTNMQQSQTFKLDSGNTISSKDEASEATKTILSSIYKVDRSKFTSEVVDGVTKFNIEYELNEFGEPILVDFNIIWNKLAKILAGSFDKVEMYTKLQNAIKSEPEIKQLLSLLPNPSSTTYKDNTEFSIDVNFWQDLKKPRISYLQLNINKTPAKNNDAVYDARMAKADFPVTSVIRDWNFGFVMDIPSTNKFLIFDEIESKYVLDIKKVFSTFTDKQGNFKSELSKDFLDAVGIRLDYTNKAIKDIVDDPKFGIKYGVDQIFKTIRAAVASSNVEARFIASNPIKYIMEGVTKDPITNTKTNVSNSRVKELAKIQAANSDKYSNFSALSPEGNRVWEHFLDSTTTRVITSINHAKSWQELTRVQADPSNKFQHMRWLSEDINPYSLHSQLLASIFNLRDKKKPDGSRLNNSLLINNVAGTQLIEDRKGGKEKKEGISTASMDKTSKFLQEIHTMLMNGVEEFMRHASKQMAQGLTVTGKIDTGVIKDDSKLYVDIKNFAPYGPGESRAFDIIAGYIMAESNRIFKFGLNKDVLKNYKGYNRKVQRKDKNKTETMAGNAFTAFDDVLTEETQTELYAIIDNAVDTKDTSFDMMDVINSNPNLRARIEKDVTAYFQALTEENLAELEKAKYIDSGLKERVPGFEKLSNEQVNETLMKAYTYNSWMHKFETAVLIYGDFAQYNHAKEEFHKRNAGFGGGGRSFSADMKILTYVNSLPNIYAESFANDGVTSRNFDGTLKTAILKERVVDESIYYNEYYDAVYDDYYSRLKDKAKAKELTEITLKGYRGMEIGDGQGHVTFEGYRKLKNLEGNWLPEQEELYTKIAKGEEVSVVDIVKFFPPYKLQYAGNMQSELLPVTSFHKFSLNPIIPGVAIKGTPLYDLHLKMMQDKVDYVVYQSGSKIGHVGNGDEIFDKDGNFLKDSKFTVNTIFTEFLKNQTEVNAEFKGKSIFSTQMRKLILDNLYKNGDIISPSAKPIVEKYLKDVSDYTELVKLELLEEIGYDEVSEGEYAPRDKDSISKLLELIRANLEREDAYGNELIDFIDALDSGEIAIDLSYHPEVLKIEKVLLSMINKRIIKQKIKGEPLVQVSSAMYENNVTKTENFRNATDEEKKKWVGSNVLPTYHKKADGKTAAMKVMIALQGDYANLLNLEYKGETVETIDRLNRAIKDDEWLDANDGANRKAITLVGVRIPVQGLNSMEFMEVYQFLPAQAGNIIIPPAEIVAKSGGDFDIDKLTIFMTNIGLNGELIKPTLADIEAVKKTVKEKNAAGESLNELFKQQKAGLENELIKDVKAILELPENFVSLITPNGTFLLKETADELAKYVMDYNPFGTKMTEGKDKQLSPTRILETRYNLYKHESNMIGKATLGLGAIENTFNILFNSIGANLPNTYLSKSGDKETTRNVTLALRHRTMDVDGEKRISLSDIYDVDNINKISDVFSQAINGWVDVEKDAWIFFIQGNYEVAPVLLFLIKAGVPVKEAIYFVSQPLVRDYVEQQRLIGSTFAPMLGKAVDSRGLVKFSAMKNVIAKNFPTNILPSNAKGAVILDTADKLLEAAFKGREDKFFSEKSLLDLIEKSSVNPDIKKENKSLLLFLHYLKIEDQIKGITKIKMNANPDTNTNTTLSNIELSESTIEDLLEDEVLSPLINSLMKDSVISSFFNGPLALALSKPLFKLRYNKAFSNYIIDLKKTRKLDDVLKKTFGEDNEKQFINAFRNDFVSYIFQNALLKSKLGDTYMSYDLKEELAVKNFESKYFGAYVKTNNNGSKTLFVNDSVLKLQFENNAWSTDDVEDDNPYVVLGLHQVDPMTFTALEKDQNFEQYKKFVIEREYLRSVFPKEDSQSKAEYEKFLAEKALDNTFNFYHLFNNADTAYGNRVSKIINEYPDLVRKFDVLAVLKSESNFDQTIFNLGIADRDINSTKANMYISNLKDLANPVVLKNYAKALKLNDADIKKITEVFSMLPIFAYLQSGINKSSYNLVPFVDYTKVIDIIQDAGNEVLNVLENDPERREYLLSDYLQKFEFANNKVTNPTKKEFKSYLTNFDINKIKVSKTKTQQQADVILPIGTSGSGKSTFIKSLPQENLVVIEPDAMRVEFTGDINNKSKDKEIYIEAANRAIQAIKQGKQVVFDTTNLTKDKRRPFVEAIKKAIPNANIQYKLMPLNAKLAKQRIKAQLVRGENRANVSDETIDRHAESYKQMLEDIKSEDITDYDTQLSTSVESLATPLGLVDVKSDLIETNEPNVFLYDSVDKDSIYYKNLTNKNSKVIFLHSYTNSELQDGRNKNFTDQSILQLHAPDMTVPVLISDGKDDNFANLSADDKEEIKKYWSKILSAAENAKEKGFDIALPTAGFGNPDLMPQDLFVYLSRELYEKLRYLNPGSLLNKQVSDIVYNKQGVSDDEILQKYGFESDPFKCS
jgi:predicted kinase